MAGPLGQLPRVNWHVVGAVGSLMTQLVMGVAVLATSPSVRLGGVVWYVVTFVAIGVSYLVVRGRRSTWWFLVWPGLCLGRLLTFGLINPAAGQLVPGFITLCFLYAGLTQPQRRSLLLLPPAAAAWWTLVDPSTGAAVIRLSIAVLIWTASAELPAYLMRELRARQQLLVLAARTDVLTGARNRFGLADTLSEMRGSAFLVIVDLDHFKSYNDRFGHTAGDRLLTDFADMLQQETRKPDVVVRYGGEEFLVVLHAVERVTAESVVDRWASVWRAHPSGVTFSAGITDLADDDSVSMADAAMYAAKADGRNRAVVRMSPSPRNALDAT